mgnify:CR=1 FL=1|tara:strand:+ start:206 stop:676 length:471 start_codon:yes stop_codon:yes gene_type:complete
MADNSAALQRRKTLPILQIIYSSSAFKNMLKSDLYILLRQSRINNKIKNVSGLLFYLEGTFFQVLEGSREDVSELFAKISNDNRHTEIKILSENYANVRSFSDWEMAYASPSLKDLSTWAGLKNTTNIEEVLRDLDSKTSKVPEFLSNVLKNASFS